uniref:Uncharacterized protein n=1 Tax=Rhizophora mucronata TaxID=61149 RepID=A0A2P2QTZ6_RHIMU
MKRRRRYPLQKKPRQHKIKVDKVRLSSLIKIFEFCKGQIPCKAREIISLQCN